MNELVSILIPVYNREDFIREAVQSALKQTYSNIEVIVVDNASTDSTADIVRELCEQHSRLRLYVNSTNVGPVINWKVALGLASGIYTKFLWSDDWIEDDFVEKTLPYLQDPSVAFAFSPAWIVKSSSRSLAYRLWKEDRVLPSHEFYLRCLFSGGTPYSPGCAILRTADASKCLLTDVPNHDYLNFRCFGAGNDLLLFLLPLLQHRSFAYVDSTRSYFRFHEGSISVEQDLSLYYDYAKLFFLIRLGSRSLLRKFKTAHIAGDWRINKRVNFIADMSPIPLIPNLIYQISRRILNGTRRRFRSLLTYKNRVAK